MTFNMWRWQDVLYLRINLLSLKHNLKQMREIVCESLAFLFVAYDSMWSVPTPDMSMDVHSSVGMDAQPINPPRVIPTPRPTLVYSSTDDPFLSPAAHKHVSNASIFIK